MRLLVPPEDIGRRQGIALSAEKSHYLLNVLRAARGDRFTAIDGSGRSYLAEITDVVRQELPGEAPSLSGPAVRAVIRILEESSADAEGPARLVLCQSLLKGEKMDLVVQKATELGVSAIQPLVTERCIVRQTRKVPRWIRIAGEAAEQCGRATVPAIHEPKGLAAFLAEGADSAGIILWEEGGLPLAEAMSRLKAPPSLDRVEGAAAPSGNLPAEIILVTGPEGGLSASEVLEAQSRGLLPVTLGSRTLRAETAAIVGVALTQFILEYGRP